MTRRRRLKAQKPEEDAVAVALLPLGQWPAAIDLTKTDREHLALTTLFYFEASTQTHIHHFKAPRRGYEAQFGQHLLDQQVALGHEVADLLERKTCTKRCSGPAGDGLTICVW